MKIKFNWSSFTNISFRGEDIFECDKEDWECMNDNEKLSIAINLSGFEYGYDIIEGDGDE